MQTVKDLELSMEDRQRIAREHSALFPTRLALARWTNSESQSLRHGQHPPLRAAWLAKAQRDFQAWLDGGGFLQHDGHSQPAPAAQQHPDPGDAHHPDEWRI